jgi:hypothetical protein
VRNIRNILFDQLPEFILVPALLVSNIILSDTTRVDSDTSAVDTLADEAVYNTPVPVTLPSTKILNPPVVENKAFKIGEKFTYKIHYGFIRAGTATMEVKNEITLNNRPCYHIQTTARSAAGFNFIYKVEDVVDSYLDKQGLFSWKFNKRLREGGYKADLLVDYFPQDSLANVTFIRYKGRMKVYKQQNYTVKIPPFTLDILASLYYTRTRKLEIGNSLFITNHDNKKIYELEVKVYRKEIIDTDAGKFECLLVEPLLKGEGLFKQKGSLKIWLTNDQYKIPVLMISEIAIGHITTELEKIEGISGKIPSRIISNE